MAEMFDFLRQDERDILFDILNSVKKAKSLSKESKKLREPMPIQQWVEDPYMVGPSGMALYPYWKEKMVEVFRTDRNHGDEINELIITGGIGCKPLSARIPTSLGYLTYSELMEFDKEGIKYQVMSEQGPQDTNGVLIKGEVPTKIVQFDDGSRNECTFDHRVRAIRDSEVIWVRYDELEVGDRVLKTRKATMFPQDSIPREEAYFWGYFIGDGNTFKNHDDRRRVRINIGSTSLGEVAEETIRTYLDSVGCTVNVYESVNNYNSRYRQYNICNDGIRSKANQCGHGAANKHVPDFVYKYSFNETCEFVAGLWDSDGSVEVDSRNGSISLSYQCSSERLVRDLQVILANLGIYARINEPRIGTRDNYTNQYRLRITEYLSIKRFGEIIPLKISYKRNKVLSLGGRQRSEDITDLREELVRVCKPLGLKTKYNLGNRTAGITKLNECKEDERVTSEFLDYIYERQCYEVEVVSIEEGREICGDVSVKGSHTYYCDGFINHNTGKSTFAVFCLIRKIYELSCYSNIPGMFQLMPGSLIAFMYFSVSKTQAELTGYGQVKNIIDQIPYFQEYFKRNDRLQSMLVFPENVLLLYGSDQSHSIGLNMIGCILDEANFRQSNAQVMDRVSSDQSKVSTMYASIINRGKSRFQFRGKNHSLAILVSSNTTSSSFTEQRINQSVGNKNCLIVNARLWDVKPKGTYSSEGFWVFVGSDVIDPMICDVPEDIYQFTDSVNLERIPGNIEEIISLLPNIYRDLYTWVPNDFRKQYEDDIIMSLQDLSGYSVAPSGRLFNSKPAYNNACESIHTHPFTKNTFILSTQDSLTVKDFIRPDFYPINRDKPRYIHIDQSLAHDKTGFASTYLHHWQRDENTGIMKPYYDTDIFMSVAPPKAPRKISINKVMDMVYYMRDVWKLTIGMVTYDSYSSAGALQELESNGIPCGLLSVDRTDEQYMYLVECLLNGQIKTYRHPVAEYELFNLIHYRNQRKVDHPKAYYGSGENSNQSWGGSKDVCDAWCGSLWNCYKGSQQEQESEATNSLYKDMYEELYEDEELYSFKELTGINGQLYREDDSDLYV